MQGLDATGAGKKFIPPQGLIVVEIRDFQHLELMDSAYNSDFKALGIHEVHRWCATARDLLPWEVNMHIQICDTTVGVKT